jgi:hypothetical protein
MFNNGVSEMKQYIGVLSLTFLFPMTPVQAQWFGQGGASYEYNNNLSNAQLERDIKSDSAFRVNLSGGHYFQLADYTGLSVSADASGTHYLRFNGLNNVSYGGTATLRQKFGLGELAPWLTVSGSAAHHDFEYSPRSGWRYGAAMTIGKRLSERWEVQLGYRYEAHRSDKINNIPGLTTAVLHPHENGYFPAIPGDAFNLDANSLSLTGLFSVTDRLTAYASYTRRQGGITSTTLRNLDVFAASDAIAVDKAFGNDRFAYRIQAGTNMYSTGLSWALNGHSSVNVSYEWINSSASHNISYYTQLAQLNILYSY